MRRGISGQRPKGWGYPLHFGPSFEGLFTTSALAKAMLKPPSGCIISQRGKMGESRWASKTMDIIALVGLLALNVALVYPLFQGEYTQYRASVEPVYMAVARFITQHPLYPTWNPLWYGGYPFRIFYTPLLPYTLALVHALSSLTIPATYRLVTASLYLLAPLTWYILVLYLTKRRLTATLAALAYSLLPSFVYLIPEVRDVARGFGYAPWRLLVIMLYGEGPHTCALAFTPLAALFFLRALRVPKFANYLGAAFFIGLVALINFIALFGLGVILMAILTSEMVTGQPFEKLKRAVTSGLLTYGLCAFWFNTSFIRASFSFGTGSQVVHNLVTIWPLLLLLLLLSGLLLLFFSGKTKLQPLLLSLLWLAGLGIIVFAWYGFQLAIAPQPKRYVPELEMAFTLLLALAATWVYDSLASKKRGKVYAPLFALSLILFLGVLSLPFLRAAHTITRPGPGITDTFEYQIARWFADHVEKEERVYVTGNATFWLNLFSDVPQVRGGLDQSATNPWWEHAAYQINRGEDGSLAILWAKAFNVRYILVNYPESSDPFHDYTHPEKFEGLLEPVHSKAGNVIFEVPLATADLVRIVDLAKLRAVPPIENALDKESLQAYVDMVEGGREAYYTVDSINRASIDADLGAGEAILVRMTYDPGWRATCGRRDLRIERDPLGFMLIATEELAPCTIELRHLRVWDEWLGCGLTALTTLYIIAYGAKRKRWFPRRPAELEAIGGDP